MSKLVFLLKKIQEKLSHLFYLWKTNLEGTICDSESGSYPNTEYTGTLIWDSASRTVKFKFMFINNPVCEILS